MVGIQTDGIQAFSCGDRLSSRPTQNVWITYWSLRKQYAIQSKLITNIMEKMFFSRSSLIRPIALPSSCPHDQPISIYFICLLPQ